ARDKEEEMLQEINKKIRKIEKLNQLTIGIMFAKDDTEKESEEKVEKLKVYQKWIYKARKLKNNLAHKQKIESHIEKRYNNFADNTEKMISSIL
ncbi:34055_t:CDS:1, partial [Gigaspora margarita]